MLDQAAQVAAIEAVEARLVDLQPGQGAGGGLAVDGLGPVRLGEVAHPAQQASGDARGAAGAAGDLGRPFRRQGRAHLARGLLEHALQLRGGVELQAQGDAETVAQGRRQHARPRGRRHQGEGRQVDAHRARRRTVADHQVQHMVLHRRIEDLLHRRGQTMDLVDEQHVTRFEIGQDRGQVGGLGQDRAGGGAEVDPQLAGDDLGQGGLAEARRAEQQHVIERLAAPPRRVDEHLQVGLDRRLADELGEGLGPQRPVGPLERLRLA